MGVTARGARTLEFHSGRVTVALLDWPSSDKARGRRAALVGVVVPARREAVRVPVGDSPAINRVPNFALAEDSRPYDPLDGETRLAVPRELGCRGLTTTGFCTVTLSAPQ